MERDFASRGVHRRRSSSFWHRVALIRSTCSVCPFARVSGIRRVEWGRSRGGPHVRVRRGDIRERPTWFIAPARQRPRHRAACASHTISSAGSERSFRFARILGLFARFRLSGCDDASAASCPYRRVLLTVPSRSRNFQRVYEAAIFKTLSPAHAQSPRCSWSGTASDARRGLGLSARSRSGGYHRYVLIFPASHTARELHRYGIDTL